MGLWQQAVLVAAVFASFGGALAQVEFLSDDWDWLFTARSPWSAVLAPGHSHHYTPVFLAAWRLIALAGGGEPRAFAGVALALHAANCLLLRGLVVQLGCRPSQAFLVALVYATFSVHYGALFWATGIAHLLMVAFGLAALRSYIRAAASASPGRWLALAYLFAALCLFTLESGVAVLVACVLWEGIRWLERDRSRSARRAAGALARALPLLLLVLSLVGLKAALGGRLLVQPGGDWLRTAGAWVEFLARVWMPSERALAWVWPLPVRISSFLAAGHPALAAMLLTLLAGLPVALAWSRRGTPCLRFASLWLVAATGLQSFGAGVVTGRYFTFVALPGAIVFVLALQIACEVAAARLRGRGAQRIAAGATATAVLALAVDGWLHNRAQGRAYQQAAQATRQLLASPVLEQALRARAGRRLLVLDLPDRFLAPAAGGAAGGLRPVVRPFLFRNGFAEAVFLRHAERLDVTRDDVEVGRTPQRGLASNVWPYQRAWSAARLEAVRTRDSHVVLAYDARRRGFVRLD